MATTILERFFAKVEIITESGCWIWTAHVDKDGYGQLQIDQHPERAHRFSFRTFVGEIPKGLFVLHRCDVPSCVNPSHLFVGSALENNRDRERKGRGAKRLGESNPQAKLTAEQVALIRASDKKQQEIAAEFGISRSHVSEIRSRKNWGRIPGA